MTRAGRLAALSSLYFVQGLPTGFVADALKPYLTKVGVPLSTLGLLTFLGAPWWLKVVFGPFVDKYRGGPLGPRKTWILPLQLGMALTCAFCATLHFPDQLGVAVAAILVMNTFAATMDVAVDGLAVDMIGKSDLGHANSAQVVAFKGGMFAAGVALAWIAAKRDLGLSFVFGGMAVFVVVVMLATFWWKEPPREEIADEPVATGTETSVGVLPTLVRAISSPAGLWMVLFVATYKLGESLIDAMYQPFLVRSGHELTTVHAWLGWGMIASMLGSLAGGTLAASVPLHRALVVASLARAAPLFAEWWLAATLPGDGAYVAVTVAEHFFGGALTVVVFAVMMASVNKAVGASHYTALAVVEVGGKFLPGLAAGYLAERMGFAMLFATGAFLQLGLLALVLPLRAGVGEPEVAPVGPGGAEGRRADAERE